MEIIKMETRELDGIIFRRILMGGAQGIRAHIKDINDLNVFPVPDGDTGTNMSKTFDSGVAKIASKDEISLSEVAEEFATGSLFGARGNSGVILSQFFAGVCGALSKKNVATAKELADAYLEGVKRAYTAVANPVEGTILTVFREGAEYAAKKTTEADTLEAFFKSFIEEAERSLKRTPDLLPVLAEAGVVDSGGAGFLCITHGMHESLSNETFACEDTYTDNKTSDTPVDYDLFTTDSVLEYGYCTECLVRLQRAKAAPEDFDEKAFVEALDGMGCDSIVALRDGDVLKIHAHTMTPGDILALCQKYGEFLNVKIENMSLQHSDRVAAEKKKPSKPHKLYGVVTVATGDGMCALFESLGADVIINGGQTGNPSAEQFLEAFESINADRILVFPNNGNILLTATQAASLWKDNNVTVIPTKTLPEGYAALSVFNPSVTELDEQISDLLSAKNAVVSGEITVAIKDSHINGMSIAKDEYIGILQGEIVASDADAAEALCAMLEQIEDIEDRELITLFTGEHISDDERVRITELLEDRFDEMSIEVYVGGQEIYDYLIAVE